MNTDKRGKPLPRVAAGTLRRQTRKIEQAGAVTRVERAALMAQCYADGYSLDSIATAAGLTREGVRKIILARSDA